MKWGGSRKGRDRLQEVRVVNAGHILSLSLVHGQEAAAVRQRRLILVQRHIARGADSNSAERGQTALVRLWPAVATDQLGPLFWLHVAPSFTERPSRQYGTPPAEQLI